MTFTLDDAYQLAKRAHTGQTDKAGKPYILHPLAVAQALAEHGEQAQIAGMLHDVIEDTDVTADDLLAAGVEPHTVEAVLAVTRQEGEVYADFILRAGSHPMGILVKRADIGHNSNPERLAALEPKQAASLAKRYEKALTTLDSITWKVIYVRYGHDHDEECDSLEQAIACAASGEMYGNFAPVKILAPNGSVALSGGALSRAMRAYEDRLSAVHGVTP